MKQKLSQLIRDPITIFIICGVLVFVFYEYTVKDRRPNIFLSKEAQTQLIEGYEAVTGEQAGKNELADIIQGYFMDELFFQEAIEQNLHLSDPSTRSSLIEIMHYRISQTIEDASDEELISYYANNITNYYAETTYSFKHVFFASLPDKAENYKALLNNGNILKGDNFVHGNEFKGMTLGLLSGVFGKSFTTNLQQLSVNKWQGPVNSNYGVHFVLLLNKQAPYVLPFSVVKLRVAEDYRQNKGDLAIMAKYNELKAKYETTLEP